MSKEIKKDDNVYVHSEDKRNRSFEGVVTSIGSKFITVTESSGRKWRFRRNTLICEEWSIYRLYKDKEDADNAEQRKEQEKFIIREISYALRKVTNEEFDTMYNIIKKYR